MAYRQTTQRERNEVLVSRLGACHIERQLGIKLKRLEGVEFLWSTGSYDGVAKGFAKYNGRYFFFDALGNIYDRKFNKRFRKSLERPFPPWPRRRRAFALFPISDIHFKIAQYEHRHKLLGRSYKLRKSIRDWFGVKTYDEDEIYGREPIGYFVRNWK